MWRKLDGVIIRCQGLGSAGVDLEWEREREEKKIPSGKLITIVFSELKVNRRRNHLSIAYPTEKTQGKSKRTLHTIKK